MPGVFTPPPEPLPAAVEQQIEASVLQFRARLGMFCSDAIAAEYRAELEKVARVAMESK